jgi:hypothetical protein
LAGPVLGGNKSFDGITTLNIKILGADHFDYFPVPDGSNKIGEFILMLTEKANNPDDLKSLLKMRGITQKEDGTYEVDPNLLPNN